MKINKFYNTLGFIGLALALTFLPGCNKTTNTFKETTTSNNLATTTPQDQGLQSQQTQETTHGTEQVAEAKESQIHFIDTGNSDAILIINDGEAMLIDGGENDDEEFLVKYLKDQGVTELEYLIATHPHADHVGALDAVVANLHVNTIFVANGDSDTKTYRDFIEAAMDKGLTPSVPLEDSEFPLGSAYFRVMNTKGNKDTNNQSLVVEYVNGEDKALFMGDAEKEVEEEILSKVNQVNLLKLGHHGSRTSTSQAFLEKVNLAYAVITCGTDNKYGHPHQETLDKLQGIEVHRTDECGSIIFKSTGHGMTTACENGDFTPGIQQVADNEQAADQTPGTISEPSTSPDVQNTHEIISDEGVADTETVYWTPKGKSYHKTDDCSALVNSKTILSGTISESGKYDPCDRCYK